MTPTSLLVLLVLATSPGSALAKPAQMNVRSATLLEQGQKTPEVSTKEVEEALARKEAILDVRSAQEYAIGHIPGSINLYEKEVEKVIAAYPDLQTRLLLYCNGPHCGKSKRLAEQLLGKGYKNIVRYQLGLPIWRALGNTVQSDLEGVRYIVRDKTAVFVDARPGAEFAKGSLPGAVNVALGEAEKANEDGRLPQSDKGTRVVVFGGSPEQARAVAEQIAHKAYWNSSYFGGTLEQIRTAFPQSP